MYSYDDLNRITRADYATWRENSKFNLGSISYDKNGNLQRLYRRGAIVDQPDVKNSSHYGTMDYLTYTYDGNQLLNVRDTGDKNYGFKDGNIPSSTDDADDYDYDANGNMTIDNNKGISSITYNHLNLPTKVTINEKNIDYIYDATGVKLEKRVNEYSEPFVTQYAGNYIYKKNAGIGAQFELQFFNTSEGYATPNNSGEFDYIYQHKDHLGNVRLSYKENTNTGQETVFTDGFESMANWDKSENNFGWALTTIDNSKKKSGDYSGRIDDNYPANWEKYIYSDTWTAINNSEETFYTVSGWVFVEDIPNNDAQLWLSSRKAGETSYPSGNFSTTSTTRGKWEYLSLTILVPADVRELNIRIDNNKAGKVWFDDIKIVKGNAAQTVVVEESNYYPFGLKHKGYNNVVSSNGNSTAQKWNFLGQESNEELGLNWLTFRYRNYDAATARFFGVDPVAEEYMSITTYQFAHNNPIWKIEIEGLEGATTNKEGKGDALNHEPIKVRTASSDPKLSFIGPGGLLLVQETTKEVIKKVVVKEVKKTILNKVLTSVASGAGTLITALLLPETAHAPGPPKQTYTPTEGDLKSLDEAIEKIDEKLQVDKPETATLTNEDSPITRINTEEDSSKNEKHGDSGRALTKAEKQIKTLENKLEGANKKERKKINVKINNIRKTAQEKLKGTEHSKTKKR